MSGPYKSICNSYLTFSYHINITVNKTSQLCGWIHRTFRTRSRYVMMTLFKSLVQSRLDYCSQLWSPSLQSEINRVEKIQKNFIDKIYGLSNMDYWSQLRELNLYSQERRRERYICIFIWKIATGKSQGYELLFNHNPRRGRECHISSISKKAPLSVQKALEAGLSVRGAKIFNLLPAHIRNMEGHEVTVAHFKKELDEFLQSIPDQPTTAGFCRAAQTNSLLHQIPMVKQNNYN